MARHGSVIEPPRRLARYGLLKMERSILGLISTLESSTVVVRPPAVLTRLWATLMPPMSR